MREHVERVLQHYKTAKVEWVVAGRHKPGFEGDGVVASSWVFHISLIISVRKLENASAMRAIITARRRPDVKMLEEILRGPQSLKGVVESIHVTATQAANDDVPHDVPHERGTKM